MASIRKFVYATLLALTTLTFAPSPASAQEPAHGKFTLTHDVHWQNALVPAGDYQFSFVSESFPHMLTLTKLTGTRVGFLLLVPDMDDAKPSDVSQLLVETTPQGSYVSAMDLPGSGVTLRFKVPSQTAVKQIARAQTPPLASAR